MRGLYNIHDGENKRMGFVPFVGSSKSAPVVATTSPSVIMPGVSTGLSTFTIVAIIIGSIVVITVSVVLFVIYCLQVF